MKFAQYHIAEPVKKSLAELGFVKPTDIQFKAIPSILKGEDVLAIAQTGTGKTAAFAIPIVHLLSVKPIRLYNGEVRCLVMVPTRELAVQITAVFKEIARYSNLHILSMFGGIDQNPQTTQLKNGVDILVTTPGRMFDLRSQGFLDLSRVEILVLDEADHMLALGFIRDIRDTKKHLPKFHQTLFFSATINETIKELAFSMVRNAIRIQISPKDKVSKNVTHQVAYIEMDDKRFFLERVIKQHEEDKFLIFVRTKVRAERVFAAMERVGIQTLTLHGDKAQADRLQVMDAFRKDEAKVLIATDVSARGIDIPGVQYVINYDVPDVPENYVHRVGRTGRGMEKGIAISFCAKEEKPLLDEIQTFLGKPIDVLEIDRDIYTMTKALSEEPGTDWRKLVAEHEAQLAKRRPKKPKKKK